MRRRGWLIVAGILIVLFISSSMTYRQQSLVPWLTQLLGHHGPKWLAGVDFWWADQHISTQVKGPAVVIEFFLRKLAHFGTYLVLGAGLAVALRKSVTPTWLRAGLLFFACTGLAAFDEFHQGFTPGRSPLFQDVMLDAAGAAVGIMAAVAIQAVQTRRRRG